MDRFVLGAVIYWLSFFSLLFGYGYMIVMQRFDILPFSVSVSIILIHVVVVFYGLIAGHYLNKVYNHD